MNWKKWLVNLSVVALLICMDAFVKSWATSTIAPMQTYSHLYPFGGIPVFQQVLGVDFTLGYVQNQGAAWGLLSNHPKLLMALRSVFILCLLPVLFYTKKGKWVERVSYLLILGGALGNYLDMVKVGHVVDLFYFHFFGQEFPLFNVADSLIFIGGFTLFFHDILFRKRKETRKVSKECSKH